MMAISEVPSKQGGACCDSSRSLFRIVIPSYPTFNIYSRIADKTTALGPVCIATVVNLMEGWEAEVIDENNLGKHGPRAEDIGADHAILQALRPVGYVGLYGGLTSTIPRLYEIARLYKQDGTVVIAGGQHFVDENVEEALDQDIDYVVFGEAEDTIRLLLTALRDGGDVGKVPGIAFRRDGETVRTPRLPPITKFDNRPLADFSLVRYARLKIFPIERIRGCGMDCEFCTVKGRPRPSTPERMLRQVDSLVVKHNARFFFVVDDLFGQQRDETLRLCRLLTDYQRSIGTRLDFTVQIRLDKARDTELLSAMRAAGVNAVAIGFESPVKEELTAMNKRIRPEEMLELSKAYRKAGFLVHGMFIFGYPIANATFDMPLRERIRRFRRFFRKAKIDTVQVLLPVPLPGTELRRRLSEENRVYHISDVGWEFYDGNFPLFEPSGSMTPKELQNAAQNIMGHFYKFQHLFMVGVNTLSFPWLVFFLHNLRTGWWRWFRPWRNSIVRFGGWLTIRGWNSELKKSPFGAKLNNGRERLRKMRQAA